MPELGVLIDGGPGAGLARSEADCGARAVGDGGRNEGGIDVDPGGMGSPEDEAEVLAGLVVELIGIWSIITKPDTAVRGLGVVAEGFEAHL